MSALRPKHIKALSKAVTEAEMWRGTLVGNPDRTALEAFDKFIDTAREAVRIVSREHKAARPKKAAVQ